MGGGGLGHRYTLCYVFIDYAGRTLLKQGPYGGKPVVRRALIITPGSLVKVRPSCTISFPPSVLLMI